MRFRLQYRRYKVPFRFAVRTARAMWTEREGVIVRLETADEGRERPGIGFGEAAPIPEFGTETIDEAEEAVRELGEWVETERLDSVPARLGCLHHALAMAREEAERNPETGERKPEGGDQRGRTETLGVAALLPAGRAVLAQIPPRVEMGFRIFKWKVGVGDLADELALLDDVCAALPSGAKLRLDANGAWDRRKAERWLERCAERPVEFVEQPCFADRSEGARAAAKAEDLLLGLAEDFPTPLALDESLVSEGDVARWIARGWPGVFVVKPSLLGDVRGTLAQLEKAKAAVVFSSALETAVGAKSALRVAFEFAASARATEESATAQRRDGDQSLDTESTKLGHRGAKRREAPVGENTGGEKAAPPRALGFGVWPLFADTRFNGPVAVPFLRREDVERLDVEAVWTALS